MKRKFGTRVKWFRENYWISRGLPPPLYLSVEMAAMSFLFLFFSFFGYRETCNFGTQLETSGLNFYIFGLSIETFLFRFAKFLTRSRASTVSIRERKMRKMYRDTMHLVHSCNFSKFSKENEPDFQMWSNYESLCIFL